MRERWLFLYSVGLVLLGATALVFRGDDSPADLALPLVDASETTTTTTAPTTTAPTTKEAPPSVFPPLAVAAEVPAIRTVTGLVLPVTGGGPGGWEVMTPCASTAVVAGDPVRGAHIVLDPGHGGSEPGAVGPSGQLEKDVNLDVARRVATRLEQEGASVAFTRPGDQRVTLQTRGAIAQALRPIAFVSIHHNAAPIGSSPTPGSELYHQLESPTSKRLAGLLWEELQTAFAPFGTDWAIGDAPGARARQSARTGDDFYGVLRRSQGVPAVLTEAAYLSDPEEDALLATEEFRAAEAAAIVRAILRLVGTDDPGSGFVATKVSDTPAGPGGGSGGCEEPPLS